MSEQALRVVCMDCKTVIKEGDQGAPVSHGICDRCFKIRMDELTAKGYVDLPVKKEGAA